MVRKKTVRHKKLHNTLTLDYKKDNNYSLISLNNKFGFSQEFLDYRARKRTLVENVDLNNKIPLLVNIIKIFIKNFILYLKTRADNLLMLNKGYDKQNKGNGLMDGVEASEYEKTITKHKLVKINLEYIFSLYLEKFLCLYQYKEIEFQTNFDQLRNIYVITDEFNFIYYIRQIYTYLYYIIPKKEGFIFEYNEENNTMKIIIRKKNDIIIKDELYEFFLKDNKNYKDEKSDMSQIIQTKEMTKEVLYSMSKQLNFDLDIYDNENIENPNNNNIYLSITMPIQKKDKSEEDDEFKDEEISEMVHNDTILLENQLKRQLPTNDNFDPRQSAFSNKYIADLIIKNPKDYNEIPLYIKKENHLRTRSNNNLRLYKNSDNSLKNININNNEKPKKILINSNKSNDSFLNKCLKISEKNKQEKYKTITVNKPKRGRSDKLLKIINIKKNPEKRAIFNNLSKNEIIIKRKKYSGVFTKINNLGFSEELDYNDISISNLIEDKNKKKEKEKEKITDNPNIITRDKHNKETLNSIINTDMNMKTKNSTNAKTTVHDIKNNSKIKSSYITTEEIDGENKNINININNNNNIINIINDNSLSQNKALNNLSNNNKEKKVGFLVLNNQQNKNKNNNNYKLPEIDKHPKRLSQNITPITNPKDCMTFFNNDEKKENISKDKKTLFNESINQNKSLFIEANKERELSSQKQEKASIVELEEEQSEENEEIEDNKESSEEKVNCNCLDILIVDDEEFNVMATKKMLKKIGYESDEAYNGEECINLIKQKQKLNCSCHKNYYKIIFLDIVMPVLDGIKTAKIIQEMIDKKEINENIKIIFVSGNIDGNDLKQSLLQIDCVKECLQKPVRVDKYQKILEKYYRDV